MIYDMLRNGAESAGDRCTLLDSGTMMIVYSLETCEDLIFRDSAHRDNVLRGTWSVHYKVVSISTIFSSRANSLSERHKDGGCENQRRFTRSLTGENSIIVRSLSQHDIKDMRNVLCQRWLIVPRAIRDQLPV